MVAVFWGILVSVPCSHVCLDLPLILCLPTLSYLILIPLQKVSPWCRALPHSTVGPVWRVHTAKASPAPSHAHFPVVRDAAKPLPV